MPPSKYVGVQNSTDGRRFRDQSVEVTLGVRTFEWGYLSQSNNVIWSKSLFQILTLYPDRFSHWPSHKLQTLSTSFNPNGVVKDCWPQFCRTWLGCTASRTRNIWASGAVSRKLEWNSLHPNEDLGIVDAIWTPVASIATSLQSPSLWYLFQTRMKEPASKPHHGITFEATRCTSQGR